MVSAFWWSVNDPPSQQRVCLCVLRLIMMSREQRGEPMKWTTNGSIVSLLSYNRGRARWRHRHTLTLIVSFFLLACACLICLCIRLSELRIVGENEVGGREEGRKETGGGESSFLPIFKSVCGCAAAHFLSFPFFTGRSIKVIDGVGYCCCCCCLCRPLSSSLPSSIPPSRLEFFLFMKRHWRARGESFFFLSWRLLLTLLLLLVQSEQCARSLNPVGARFSSALCVSGSAQLIPLDMSFRFGSGTTIPTLSTWHQQFNI